MLEFLTRHKTTMPSAEDALPGREVPIVKPGRHAVLDTAIGPPFPEDTERAIVGMGCFWGAERMFWGLPGVHTTAVGYAGGHTPNPTYREVCSGRTGHAEVTRVVFDPAVTSLEELLKHFWEQHDPTTPNRQGNDVGTQYRSAIYYTSDDQRQTIEATRAGFEKNLKEAGYGSVATEIAPVGPFYYAEDYHQQYLHKVPNGYCGLGGTGVSCPVGLDVASETANGSDATLEPLPTNDEGWRERLTPEQYSVLREAGTERPFSGEYVDTDTDGMYHCAACGNALFDAGTQFHSGTGWPSFTEAVSPEAVELIEDRTRGMVRTEARCARCHSHLGHVFEDGPREAGGQRWCMNSVALDLEQR